jgi:hypothetical protein
VHQAPWVRAAEKRPQRLKPNSLLVLRGAQQLAEKFHLNAGNVPQRLKPDLFVERSGAAEAAPFQNGLQTAFFHRL